MKADKNAGGAEKRSTMAFYPELAEGKGAFDFVRDWLETKRAETAPCTYEFYAYSTHKLIEHLGPLADEPLAQITKNDLLKFRNALVASGLAAKTVNIHLKAVRMLFKAARRYSLIGEDSGEFVASVRSRSSGSKRSFTVPQLRAVLALADPEWRSLVVFGLCTGQRLGDLARLTWDAIDLQKNVLRLRTAKTDRLLAIPLAAPLRRHIESLERPIDPIAPLHPRAFGTVGPKVL
jgi:integrase